LLKLSKDERKEIIGLAKGLDSSFYRKGYGNLEMLNRVSIDITSWNKKYTPDSNFALNKTTNNKEKALNAKNEILAKNQEKQEEKQKQENAKKLAEQTEEVAKLKKAVQTAENLREKNAKLAEQYENNPTQANKDALDKSGREFANARDDVSEYDNGEYAQTHKYENSFTVDKDRQIKQNFDTALGDMSQEQKDILARADYDSDDFAEGVIEREQAGRDYAQEQADFYALGGGEDKLKDEKDLASLEDFFDKLLKDDDLADVNNDEKTEITERKETQELYPDYKGQFTSLVNYQAGDEYNIITTNAKTDADSGETEPSANNKLYISNNNAGSFNGDYRMNNYTTGQDGASYYQYTKWGSWNKTSLSQNYVSNSGITHDLSGGHWVIGRVNKEIPKYGQATYNGKLSGDHMSADNVYSKNSMSGTIKLEANFATSTLNGNLSIKHNGSSWSDPGIKNGKIENSSGRMGGDISSTFGGSGSIGGYFYGKSESMPTESGGQWWFFNNDGTRAAGSFRASNCVGNSASSVCSSSGTGGSGGGK
jgi:hypothetical protein